MPVIKISEELFKEVQKYALPLVDNFESALWKALKKEGANVITIKPRRARTRASGKLTPPKDFWKPILESMIERGGSASRKEYKKDVEKKIGWKLLPGDFEHNLDGTLKWNKQVDFQRLAMVKAGLIRKGSKKGSWEITELGRRWFNSHR
jgi:hypothetical protein